VTTRESRRWFCGVVVLAFLLQPVKGGARDRHQDTKSSPPPVHLTAEQDHQRIMDLLRVTSLQRGADGDRKSANAANYDEAKANPYPRLPDTLTLKNGKEVKSAKEWWELRRPEIAEDFDREIYGRVP
jgi:hypothetical protein